MEVILNNGIKMPMIGLGTHLLRDPNKCKSLVTAALKCGYKLIDTAAVYENESAIGCAISDNQLNQLDLKREDIFITTKLSPSDHGPRARAAALECIKRLNVKYLDLMLIHWPGVTGLEPSDVKNSVLRKETWTSLEQLVNEGLIKSIGVSNYTENHIEELLSHAKINPVINQVEFHPFNHQTGLLNHCSKLGIKIQAYSSLGSANGWDDLKSNLDLMEISKKKGKTIAQVLLKWALNQGVLIIPKTSKIINLPTNLDLNNFDLNQEEMNTINKLNKNKRYSWDPNTIR